MNRRATADRNDTSITVEGLRGLAALMVVYAHYWQTAGIQAGATAFAFTGVDLFFVLSGFVFAPYFFGRPLALTPFLVRRICRIYPLYVLGVLAYAGWRGHDGQTLGLVLRHLLFAHTLESREIAFALNPAFWSLPPEVEFYLALPLLALLFGRVQSSARVMGLVVLALALRLALSWHEPRTPGAVNLALILNVHLPGLLIEFLIGVVVWHGVRSPAGPGLRRLVALLGTVLLGWTAWRFSVLGAAVAQDDVLRGNLGLLAAVAYGAMLVWVLGLQPQRAWLVTLCEWAGALSFGTYIFHNATLPWVRQLTGWGPGLPVVLLALLACLALAWALHLLVEAPMRAHGRRWSARWSARHAQA